ncbi:hypothetical protein OV203_10150 [Nannocystis sp. ILAH1]|uniref:hypothetical protein n=1 Tax=Nannocystis sp. ILAH1 TaxID=2996789 RepID=UPI00226F66CB|nr:hypothetical protein [Nannocystis sp. ILAH1]MCY0987485.1 hypothetical protein [Nannocystis sp. ILAH1]
MVSSQDLHPLAGARFVCEREPGEPLRYQARVYVAGGATVDAALTWDAAGQATLAPTPEDEWVANELLKLARVLKHSGQARLVRWRG